MPNSTGGAGTTLRPGSQAGDKVRAGRIHKLRHVLGAMATLDVSSPNYVRTVKGQSKQAICLTDDQAHTDASTSMYAITLVAEGHGDSLMRPGNHKLNMMLTSAGIREKTTKGQMETLKEMCCRTAGRGILYLLDAKQTKYVASDVVQRLLLNKHVLNLYHLPPLPSRQDSKCRAIRLNTTTWSKWGTFVCIVEVKHNYLA